MNYKITEELPMEMYFTPICYFNIVFAKKLTDDLFESLLEDGINIEEVQQIFDDAVETVSFNNEIDEKALLGIINVASNLDKEEYIELLIDYLCNKNTMFEDFISTNCNCKSIDFIKELQSIKLI